MHDCRAEIRASFFFDESIAMTIFRRDIRNARFGQTVFNECVDAIGLRSNRKCRNRRFRIVCGARRNRAKALRQSIGNLRGVARSPDT
jgi:hypothetical protein